MFMPSKTKRSEQLDKKHIRRDLYYWKELGRQFNQPTVLCQGD